MAAALSYMTTLSFLPLVALTFYIYKFFGGIDAIIDSLKPLITKYFAPDIGGIVFNHVSSSLTNNNIETIGITGLIVFFISSFYLLSAVENVINIVWKIKTKRKLWRKLIRYFSILIIAPFLVALLFSATTLGSFLPHFDIRWSLFGGMIVFFTLVYKYLPNAKVKWSSCLTSAFLCSGLLLLLKHGYAYYLKTTLTYNLLYGSFAVLPIMQLWIYLTWLIILMGVVFSAVINQYLTRPLK